uniref:Uncharacterized protein n=1 Tax=Anopheles farauti TaxID=69004 RepID=A0A182QWH9_9DIPT
MPVYQSEMAGEWWTYGYGPENVHLLHVMVVVRLVAAQVRHVVPRVAGDGVLDDERQPQGGRQHMATHQLYAEQRWQQIAEDVLDRMRVDGGPGDRCRKLVVLLVDQLVQMLRVEQPMAVVEPKLPSGGTDQQITHHLVEGRECTHVHFCAACDQGTETEQGDRQTDQQLVDQHGPDDLRLVALACTLKVTPPSPLGWVIKRPPHGRVGHVRHQTRGVTPIKPAHTVPAKDFPRNIARYAQPAATLVEVDTERIDRTVLATVRPHTEHHRVLRNHVERHDDGLTDERGTTAGYKRFDPLVRTVLSEQMPDALPRHQHSIKH